jgi:SAM-dependent methyltransferase
MSRYGSDPMKTHNYLLGDTRREARRLRDQARLWDPVSHALFDRLDIGKGWRILEIGPGQGSLHLELRRRAQTAVDAVEPSAAFAARLAMRCRRDGLGRGRIWQANLGDASLPVATYDLIFTRWVFLFLPEFRAHVRKLVRSLKPGGLLAIQDYHRETMALVPESADWPAFMERRSVVLRPGGRRRECGGASCPRSCANPAWRSRASR